MTEKLIPIIGIPAHAEYHEHHPKSWHKGFVIQGQTTVRLRRHHLELLNAISERLELHLPRKMDLSRWEFGHAGIFIRALARIQLRDQLVELNATPLNDWEAPIPDGSLSSCFASAMRCECDIDLDRLRDTLLDVLPADSGYLQVLLNIDSRFQEDNSLALENWHHEFSRGT